jgi:hypothetical protein
VSAAIEVFTELLFGASTRSGYLVRRLGEGDFARPAVPHH